MTNVPPPLLTDTGFVPPLETDVLTGVQEDFNEAFNTTLNFGTVINPTPQGQLAVSEAACIGNANDVFCELAQLFDPAYSYGRFQDAIARIYYLTRNPDTSTAVVCTCVGMNATILPGALAQDESGNLYFCVSGGTFPVGGGTLSLTFQCQTTGPIPCPAGTLTTIFQTVPGWDTITNPADGVLGTNVENRVSFEARRQSAIQKNTVGFNSSILGAVLVVPNVLDAYVTDNDNSFQVAKTPVAVIKGSISATTLTISSVLSGVVSAGLTLTGSDGGTGLTDNTTIVSGSGTSWVVNNSQTIGANTTMNVGGVVLSKNQLFVAAVGGDSTAIATAIWTKKSPGCSYYGNTTVTVYDTNAQYPPPGVPYNVTYEIPSALPFVVTVTIANSVNVPADALAQVQAVVIAAFAGTDNGARAKIGSTVYASRFYAGIGALGSWAEVVSIFIGSTNAPAATGTASMGAAFTATGSGTNLTISAISDGYISVGDTISGTGIPNGTTIVSQSSGTTGSTGVYVTSAATTASSAACVGISSVLDVSAIASGTLAVNQIAFDAAGNVLDGTTILSQTTGSTGSTGTYTTSMGQQRVASETMNFVIGSLLSVPTLITQVPTITANDVQLVLV